MLCIHELFERTCRRPTSSIGPSLEIGEGDAVRAGAQHDVENALGATSITEQSIGFVGVETVGGGDRTGRPTHDLVEIGFETVTAGDRGEPQEDLPFVRHPISIPVGLQREHCRRVVRHIANGEVEQQHVVMALVER